MCILICLEIWFQVRGWDLKSKVGFTQILKFPGIWHQIPGNLAPNSQIPKFLNSRIPGNLCKNFREFDTNSREFGNLDPTSQIPGNFVPNVPGFFTRKPEFRHPGGKIPPPGGKIPPPGGKIPPKCGKIPPKVQSWAKVQRHNPGLQKKTWNPKLEKLHFSCKSHEII